MNKTLLVGLALAAMAQVAKAQYMYIDTNGDQVNDADDRMNPNGTPTTVDIWLSTDTNADGSPAADDPNSPPGTPHTLNSYVINLLATNGTVAYSGFMDQQGMGTTIVVMFSDATRFNHGRGSGNVLPPGAYRLCTLTITGMTGTPRIDIVQGTSGSGAYVTCFGSQCVGQDGDNTYKLGTDWSDTDGLGAATGPVVANPGNKTVTKGGLLEFTVTSTNLTAGRTNSYSLTLGVPAATGAAIAPSTGLFSWTADLDAGIYPVTVTATDDTAESRSANFTITVVNPPLPASEDDVPWGKSCSNSSRASGAAWMAMVLVLAAVTIRLP